MRRRNPRDNRGVTGLPRIAFYEPRIPQNTGNAIRLSAVTGARLDLIEPLGFDLSEPKLRRAGLDYHDLASVRVHGDFQSFLDEFPAARVFAFTTRASARYTDITYESTDVLLFGPEPTGLPDEALANKRITAEVRIPMLPQRRSLNLTSSASIVIYEAWRQIGFAGGT